jgi:hypothetical protein
MGRAGGIAETRRLLPRDAARGTEELEGLFRSGRLPDPPLDGRYAGEFLSINIAPGLTQMARLAAAHAVRWRGKQFDARKGTGVNIVTRDSLPFLRLFWPLYHGYWRDGPSTYRLFPFRSYAAGALGIPRQQVLRIDYGLPANPGLSVRRLMDELVQLEEDLYLGRAIFHWWWGQRQVVAYFALRPWQAT